MDRTYYVILIDGAPRLKDGGTLRKYKTRERAEAEARKLARYSYYADRTVQTAKMSFIDIIDVEIPKREASKCPYPISI